MAYNLSLLKKWINVHLQCLWICSVFNYHYLGTLPLSTQNIPYWVFRLSFQKTDIFISLPIVFIFSFIKPEIFVKDP